jgi:hypothetical protein
MNARPFAREPLPAPLPPPHANRPPPAPVRRIAYVRAVRATDDLTVDERASLMGFDMPPPPARPVVPVSAMGTVARYLDEAADMIGAWALESSQRYESIALHGAALQVAGVAKLLRLIAGARP